MPEQRIPEIKLADLKDPTLFRLNMALQFLTEQIGKVQGLAGPFSFGAEIKVPSLNATGTVDLSGLGVYADNAAAISGGMKAGAVYRTAAGELRIVT